MGGKSKQTSETKIDPAVMSRATGNYDSALQFAQTPYKPFEGTLDLSAPTAAASNLLNYYAPNVSTAQNVSQDQIDHYMDPYLDQVVDATGADMEHARQVSQRDNAGAVAARGAFGNSRRGIYEAEIDSASQRNLGSVLGGLRSQGFGNAVNWGQQDLARLLQTALANQGASISSAGVRSNAAGLLGNLQTTGYNAERDQYLHEYEDPFRKRGLLNQALGSIPVPQSTTQTSKGGGLFGTGINVGWSAKDGVSFGV